MALFSLLLLTAMALGAVVLLVVVFGALTGAFGIAAFIVLLASAVIGVITRRFGEAVRALVVICAALLGLGAGLAGAWLLQLTGDARFASWTLFLYAALFGALVGAIVAMQMYRLVVHLAGHARRL